MLCVEYTSQLRRAAGVAAETIELPPECRLSELARALAQRHGEELRQLLLDGEGKLQRSILVFTGDRQIPPGADPILQEGQTITFAAPISGG